MAKMLHDDFEAWVRERAGSCVAPEIVNELCKGELDFDSGEYTFENAGVQAQWEAWQAAIASDRKVSEAPSPVDYGTNAGIRCDTDDGPCACGAWH